MKLCIKFEVLSFADFGGIIKADTTINALSHRLQLLKNAPDYRTNGLG